MYCEYGYTRKSTPKQSIDRQIRNIKALYPKAIIIQETYTGTKIDRKEWNKLYKVVKDGDITVLMPLNQKYQNIFIKNNAKLIILGKVIQTIRKW